MLCKDAASEYPSQAVLKDCNTLKQQLPPKSTDSNKSLVKTERTYSRLNSMSSTVPLPYISAQSWAIFDAKTMKLVQGKKENYKREIASITKMMTFYTVLRLLERFNLDIEDQILIVSKLASRTNGTSANL
jgi:D-alanyl-D-alanine carboxypeptidase